MSGKSSFYGIIYKTNNKNKSTRQEDKSVSSSALKMFLYRFEFRNGLID